MKFLLLTDLNHRLCLCVLLICKHINKRIQTGNTYRNMKNFLFCHGKRITYLKTTFNESSPVLDLMYLTSFSLSVLFSSSVLFFDDITVNDGTVSFKYCKSVIEG